MVENIIDSRARAAAASAARLQRDLRQQEEDGKVHLARRHADEQVRCRALHTCKDTVMVHGLRHVMLQLAQGGRRSRWAAGVC